MSKLLKSILGLAVVAALAIGGTVAYYNDTETSKDNTFTAGKLDLQIDNTSYYNGELSQINTWQMADFDDGKGPKDGQYLFFDFNDLKPGDWGEDTISLHVLNNDSWVCGDITLTANDENDLTRSELRLQDSSPSGELAQEINFVWWADDGDNVLEDNETVIQQANLGNAPMNISVPIVLADSTKNIWNPQGGPLPGNSTKYVGKAWCFGKMTLAPRPAGENSPLGVVANSGILCDNKDATNISQTDSAKMDVSFRAIQARHMDTFTCGNLKYNLAVSLIGTGTGGVGSNLAGIDCGASCTADFYHSDLVTLIATPSASSTFVGWGGACTTDPCTLSMDEARDVTAEFEIKSYPLTVSKSGTGIGIVTSSPTGITCENDCNETYTHGTEVTLYATPAESSNFTGWSGACSGTGSCTVLMDQVRNVNANFVLKTYALNVKILGPGFNWVYSTPAGINCYTGGGSCSKTYTHGTSVTLTYDAQSNMDFAGWSGACSGIGSCTVLMDQEKNVEATFANKTYTLSVSRLGIGSGTVTSSPAGINCGSTCAANFNDGSTVTLTATASPGSTFTGWSGYCSGTSSTCSLTMSAARNVSAEFSNLLSLTSTADTYVRSGATGTNYGTANSVIVWNDYGWNYDNYHYGLVRFNVPYLGGTTVKKATLKLNFTSVSGYSGIDVYPITSSWTETGVTYANQPTFDSSQNVFTWISTGTSSINLTNVVQQMTNGTRTNYGFWIVTHSNGHLVFTSKEGGVIPVLEIVY